MPHAVFNLGTLAATTEARARPLIPGIEPGGSRAGEAMKPALLIRDAWLEFQDATTLATPDLASWLFYLKLSQEADMTPGLQLPIGGVRMGETVTANQPTFVAIDDLFHAQGTVWAPRFVGVRVVENGGATTVNCDVHLDYERVDVPWMDWFIMWDFLDNIIDNELGY